MHTPRASVIALARFSFSASELEHLRAELLAEDDWQAWIDQIEAHGLSGFANKHVDEHDLPIPDAVRLPLKVLKVRHQSAARARHKVLSEVDAVFKAHQIPYLGLKGAALMPHLFKEGYLRPMRDMDLLLPESVLLQAADLLREIGFDLPREQPSKFMRDMHQLPNATKTVDGFTCSIELHRDGISREVQGHLYYPEPSDARQTINWSGLQFEALEDLKMLHQVSRHLEGLHPGAVLKLINVMDVIGLAQRLLGQGRWAELKSRYPHVLNTLRCLHELTPLPEALRNELLPLAKDELSGVGEIMGSLRNALVSNRSLAERYQLLLRPSDWWLHLYYNVDPNESLFWVKWFKHPARVINWLSRRLYSGLLGG